MGGSWDATRLASSEIAGLTNVGTDHRAWLGRERSEIARDKGRALAAARFAVIGGDVEPDIAAELGAPHARPAVSEVRCGITDQGRVSLDWAGGTVEVALAMRGRHQARNAQLALALAVQAVAAGWLPTLVPDRVERALAGVRWPGRLSVHRVAGRDVLVDCAHNLEAALVLAEFLAGAEERYNLVFSCLDDKPVEEMAAVLRPQVASVTVCRLSDERAMDVDRMLAAFPGAAAAESPVAAVRAAPDPVLAAGSVRLAGELLACSGDEERR